MAQGLLLIIVGIWFLLQTLAGDLPGRVLSWANLRPGAATPTVKAA